MSRSKPLLLLTVLIAPLAAQTMATTGDGSAVWKISLWNQPGVDATPFETFLYRLDESGWTRPARSATGGRIFGPNATRDGKILTWQRASTCLRCAVPPTTDVTGLDQPIRISRVRLSISGNGRWAMTPGWFATPERNQFEMQDLETGRVWTTAQTPALTFPLTADAVSIADDGAVAGVSNRSLVHWRPGIEPRELLTGTLPVNWGLSDDGQRLWAVFVEDQRPGRLVWLDIERVEQVIVASAAEWARMSADGSRLIFPSAGGTALLEWSAASRQTRVLAEPPAGVAEAVLSGNGRVVWMRTRENALWRGDAISGEWETRVAALPEAIQQTSLGVPGSGMEFGVSLEAPERFEVLIAGEQFPLVDRRGWSMVLQVPWEFAARPVASLGADGSGAHSLIARREGNPFEVRSTVWIAPAEAGPVPKFAFLETAPPLVKAARQDFGSLITPDNPASPGETVHLWLYGLGALDRPVPSGTAGPADPPARPVTDFACYLVGARGTPAAVGLRLPFVAYAPGLVGVYQVDATIPEGWPAGLHAIRCQAGIRIAEGEIPIR